MIQFNAVIKNYKAQGEKTGWTYVEIPASVAGKIKPGSKKSFRIKGKIDNYAIEKSSILPMGEGNFILPLNKTIRKGIMKSVGATVQLKVMEDIRQLEISPDLIACLKDEPVAYEKFNKLPPSHQRYWSKWITEAKTDPTRAKRIAKTVNAMLTNQTFGEALKSGT
jgi:hypothetical protein